VGVLELCGGHVVEATVETAVVPPVDPAGRGPLDVGEVSVGAWWNTVVLMHSVLNSPITVSMRALSYASATVPIEGRMPSRSRCSVKVMDVY